MKSFYSDFGTKETVDCMINGENFTAFAACGDNNIHHVDLEYGKVKHAFSGHTDFIHSMSLVYVTTINFILHKTHKSFVLYVSVGISYQVQVKTGQYASGILENPNPYT